MTARRLSVLAIVLLVLGAAPPAWAQNGAVVRTRPLCPCPQVARHGGAGSIDAAASFTCAEPR